MSQELYYTPPSDEIFEEIKRCAIEIWQGYENGTDYAQSKISRIKDIENTQDNAMYMVAMFDGQNQQKLFSMLSIEARRAIVERLRGDDHEPKDEYNSIEGLF